LIGSVLNREPFRTQTLWCPSLGILSGIEVLVFLGFAFIFYDYEQPWLLGTPVRRQRAIMTHQGADQGRLSLSSREKLAVFVGIVGLCVSATIAHSLLGDWAWGPGTQAGGAPTAFGVLARILYVAAILAGIVPWWVVRRYGPVRKIQLVEYLFSALHWGAFLLFAALAALGLSSLRAVISGDTGGFLMAAAAVGLFPLNIGKARSIGCAILTVFALLVFIVSSNPDALLGFAGCFFLTLASFIVDYVIGAALAARRTRSGGELHPA